MSAWENIVFDGLSEHEHELEPVMLEIMQKVYSGAHLPPPPSIDHWFHSPSIGYQLKPDESAPAILIINLREGEPDRVKMNTRFTINLHGLTVKDKELNRYISPPWEVVPLLTKVKQWVYDDIARQKQAKELSNREVAPIGQMTEIAEDNMRRMQEYIHRLFTHGLLKDDHVYGCPLCSSPVVQCQDCRAISCRSHSCQARRVLAIESHPIYPLKSFCHPCLEKNSKLTECPVCGKWLCTSTDFRWCFGKLLGRRSTRSLSQSTRQHSPKVIGCNTCILKQPGGSEFLMPCSSDSCWSKTRDPNLPPAQASVQVFVCDECSPDSGALCECRETWLCDSCAPRPAGPLSTCPRCDKHYCSQSLTCKKARSCANCGNTPPCEDCVTETEKTSHPDALTRACEGCGDRFCESCWNKTSVDCAGCETTVCIDCAKQCENDECDEWTSYCPECAADDCFSCGYPRA